MTDSTPDAKQSDRGALLASALGSFERLYLRRIGAATCNACDLLRSRFSVAAECRVLAGMRWGLSVNGEQLGRRVLEC